MITAICYSSKPECLVTAGRDGRVSFWSAHNLSHFKTFPHQDKNSVYLENLAQNSDRMQRARVAKGAGTKGQSKTALISCMAKMEQSAHVVVGSVDEALTIYDISSYEVCGRYKHVVCVCVCVCVRVCVCAQ